MELEFYTEDELETDWRLRAVFNYIKKYTGKNENEIKTALKAEDISELTVRRKIKRLLYLRLIEDRKVKKNGFHRFYPTDRTEFNTIEQNLDRIQILADKLRQPLFSEYVKGVGEGLGCTILVAALEGDFWRSINEIILFLLSLANNGKMSKYDSIILSRKIIDMSSKIGLLYPDPIKRLRSQLVSIVKDIKNYENKTAKKKQQAEVLEQKQVKTEYEKKMKLTYFKEYELETKQLNEMKPIFYDLKTIFESLSKIEKQVD